MINFDNLNENDLKVLSAVENGEKVDASLFDGLSSDGLSVLQKMEADKSSKMPTSSEVPLPTQDKAYWDALEPATDEVLDNPDASIWDKTKRYAGIVTDNIVNLAGTVIPLPLPDAEISDSPYTIRATANREIDAVGKDDANFQTYKLFHQLANIKWGTGDDEENLKTFYKNAKQLLVDKLGYKHFAKQGGKFVAVDKDNKVVKLDDNWWKSILASTRGDKGELYDGMIGATLGAKYGKGGAKGKLASSMVGGAVGAAFGNITDQLMSSIATGEKLSLRQRADEVTKAAVLDAGGNLIVGHAAPLIANGVVAGAKGVYKATTAMIDVLDKAKKFDVNNYVQKRIIDDMAKLPEAEQKRYLDALDFAKENNIQLTSTSVLDHPQLDQMVQELARNPFIRQGVKNLEAKSRDKLIKQVFDVLESAGPKATAEELDPLLKQELGDALGKRNATVRHLYDDFEHKVSGEVVTKAKKLTEDLASIGDKYGFKEGGKILDEEVAAADAYVKKILNPRIRNNTLDAKVLDKISSNFGKRASAYKMNNPKLYAYYNEAKGLVDSEIQKVSAYEGDDVAQALNVARKAYKEKVNIYGNKSEYSEIRKAMESDRPNEAIASLLKGDKGLDNANMLKQELGGSESGDALIGALGRKELDDALANVNMKSPSSLAKVLSSDKMKVAKRLLGEASSKKLDDIATLFEMMGRTEKLLSGAGSEIASASAASLPIKIMHGIEKLMVRLQQKRLFGKVFDNTLAQEMLHKTLKASQDASTPREFKVVDNFLKRTARTIEKETGEDFSDIYDKRKIQKAAIVERKAKEAEAEALKREVKTFKVPELAELRAVGKTANNEDVVLLNHSIGRIQQGTQTPVDVERYIKARKSLDEDTFFKAYEKEKVLELPAKYRTENIPESVANIKELRDYLMSNPELKYGNELSPASVNALVRDLEEEGVPRSMAHDTLYDELKSMHAALKDRIDEAYTPKQTASTEHVLEEPLDANGNALFAKGMDHLLVGGVAGVSEDENGNITFDPERFILGMGGYTAVKALAKNPRVRQEVKDLALFALEKAGNKLEGSVFDTRSFMAPLESFGRNFAKYKSEPKKAIAKLMKEKNGQVKGALYHPSLGEIDLVWGKVLDPKEHTGYGLAHIIDKHGEEVAKRLDDIVMGGKIIEAKGNRVVLENGDDLGVVAMRWNKEDKNWVISAYEPEKQISTDASTLAGESDNLSPKAEFSIAQNTKNVKKDTK